VLTEFARKSNRLQLGFDPRELALPDEQPDDRPAIPKLIIRTPALTYQQRDVWKKLIASCEFNDAKSLYNAISRHGDIGSIHPANDLMITFTNGSVYCNGTFVTIYASEGNPGLAKVFIKTAIGDNASVFRIDGRNDMVLEQTPLSDARITCPSIDFGAPLDATDSRWQLFYARVYPLFEMEQYPDSD